MLVRSAAVGGLYNTGLYSLIGRRYAGCGIIFMMHSIVENVNDYLRERIRCSVNGFSHLLQYLHENSFEILTLDLAFARIADPRPSRFAVLTFDDGYRDNLTHALPILERYGAPATIYVTTNMVERAMDAWWLGLVEWLRQREYIVVEGFGSRATSTFAEKVQVHRTLTRWVHGDTGRLEALRLAMSADGVDSLPLLDQQALNRSELRRLARHPLVTIGGHTTSHPWLALLSDDDARREIAGNRLYLQALLQQEVAHFAYPFGTPVSCNEQTATLVAEAGYRSGTTSRGGCIFPMHRKYPYALPREEITPHDGVADIACKSHGVYRLLRNGARFWRSPASTMAAG
jgi:peptidoglycan/xylan/chitin deacetylase (PgdA/CDA1 family)